MSITKVVIPAAGPGTRLYPATKSQPKEMLPLGTKPTIQLVVEEVIAVGLRQILIVTASRKRAIEDHFDPGDGLAPNDKCERCAELFDTALVQFFYTRQSRPRGLGDAVGHAAEFAGDANFAVALGDCVIVPQGGSTLLERMIAAHEEFSAAATIAVERVPAEATSKYGIVAPQGEAEGDVIPLADIIEKPGPARAPSNLAVCARYVFSPTVFEYLHKTEPGHGGEVQLTDAIRAMIHAGLPVFVVPLAPGEHRLDIGSFDSYARAFIRVMLTHPELGDGLRDYVAELMEELAARGVTASR